MPIAAPSPVQSSPILADHSRRPSPWHEVAHSLSTTSLPPLRTRRPSTPSSLLNGTMASPLAVPPTPSTPILTNASAHVLGNDSERSLDPDLYDQGTDFSVSTSKALRDWERLLACPNSDATRHQLVHSSPVLSASMTTVPVAQELGLGAAVGTAPKLPAERDKDGHIEYKLKLIDPSTQRFDRLVTQMMWRLKQGRNEAIYELGLADDGTVIGLTRAEMDASLQTLENMASSVGATVLVLKEIVLSSGASVINPPDYTNSSVTQSMSTSLSSSTASLASGGDAAWVIRRPDLDDFGRPRKGTKAIGASDGMTRHERARAKYDANIATASSLLMDNTTLDKGVMAERTSSVMKAAHVKQSAKIIIFDPDDMNDFDSDESVVTSSPGQRPSSTTGDNERKPLALTLQSKKNHRPKPDNIGQESFIPSLSPHSSISCSPISPASSQFSFSQALSPPSSPRAEPVDEKSPKTSEEARKQIYQAGCKKDMLHGDGSDPLGATHSSDEGMQSATVTISGLATIPGPRLPSLPYQAARPSSLRLAEVVTSPDDSFLSMLHLPLDSLSLSFANVSLVESSEDSDDESRARETRDVGWETHGGNQTVLSSPLSSSIPHEEMICVEALVVRKLQHDEWQFAGEDDSWGFGDSD